MRPIGSRSAGHRVVDHRRRAADDVAGQHPAWSAFRGAVACVRVRADRRRGPGLEVIWDPAAPHRGVRKRGQRQMVIRDGALLRLAAIHAFDRHLYLPLNRSLIDAERGSANPSRANCFRRQGPRDGTRKCGDRRPTRGWRSCAVPRPVCDRVAASASCARCRAHRSGGGLRDARERVPRARRAADGRHRGLATTVRCRSCRFPRPSGAAYGRRRPAAGRSGPDRPALGTRAAVGVGIDGRLRGDQRGAGADVERARDARSRARVRR